MSFAARVSAVPAVRRWVVDWAKRRGSPEAAVRTIALLTTEAVTNAIQHGPEDGQVTVTAADSAGGWRVTVMDEGPGVPVRRDVDPTAVGGRGVMLIDRLATAWGVERYDGGVKAVWFLVEAP